MMIMLISSIIIIKNKQIIVIAVVVIITIGPPVAGRDGARLAAIQHVFSLSHIYI